MAATGRYKVSFWGNKNVLELDGGDNCTTPNIIKATSKEEILWHVNDISCCYKKLRNLPKFTKVVNGSPKFKPRSV